MSQAQGLREQRDALGEMLDRLVKAVEGVGFNPVREPGLALAEARLLVREWQTDTEGERARGLRAETSDPMTSAEFDRHVLASMFGTPAEQVPRVRAYVDGLRDDVRTLVDIANHEDDCPVWGETDESGPDGHECACRYGPIAARYPYNADGEVAV